MTFSPEALGILVYGSLIWCAISAVGLGVLLVRDIAKGNIW